MNGVILKDVNIGTVFGGEISVAAYLTEAGVIEIKAAKGGIFRVLEPCMCIVCSIASTVL